MMFSLPIVIERKLQTWTLDLGRGVHCIPSKLTSIELSDPVRRHDARLLSKNKTKSAVSIECKSV